MSSAPAPVDLPHTWRPLGVRLAVIFFGGMLLVVCAFAWFGFDPEIRARFTTLQRITLLGVGAMALGAFHALGRSRVVASDDGLTVVNGYRTHRYEWAEVVAIHLTSGAPWASLDLSDGTTMSVLALQSSDGDRAAGAVREIRRLLDR